MIRVYIGSFWSHPLLIPDNRKLFEAEEQDLFKDIQSLPRNAALRKLNDLIKRARLAKVRCIGKKTDRGTALLIIPVFVNVCFIRTERYPFLKTFLIN